MKWEKATLFAIVIITFLILSYFFLSVEPFQKMSSIKSKNSIKNGFILKKLVGYGRDLIPQADLKICPISKGKIIYNNTYWQHCQGTNIYLYSAFFDNRYIYHGTAYAQVRILGMTEGTIENVVNCILWKDNIAYTVPAQYTEIWVKKWDVALDMYYRPYIFSCPLPQGIKTVDGVSIVVNSCEIPSVYIPIQQSQSVIKKDFVVCVKGMDYESDISLRLIEWIELQLILGADKIALYIYSIHPKVRKVLEYYQNIGKIDMKNISLPGKNPNDPMERTKFLHKNVWQKRRHELIPYNDCFYRHIHSHNFVLIIDLDEVVVPIHNMNWKQMMTDLFAEHPDALETYCSLSVRNVYFFDEFGVETKNLTIPSYMHILKHIYRSANFSKLGHAVKSFCSTNNTLAVFNHYALIPLYAKLSRNGLINENLAQLHHYRSECPPQMKVDCQTNFLRYRKKDITIWKYATKLINKVEYVVNKLHLK